MVVIALSRLRACWKKHPEAEEAIKAWYHAVTEADWGGPPDVKRRFASVSILKNGRAVFNLKGNKYRLVTYIRYSSRTVYVRWIGTHAEYDGIDAQEI